MLLSDLQHKEVINIHNCQKIGHITDIELDENNGQIHKLIISDGFHFCKLFSTPDEIVIRYCDIKQIGPDIILVDLCCH